MSPERKSYFDKKDYQRQTSPFKNSTLVNQINDEMSNFLKVTPKEWGQVRQTQDGRLHDPERWSHREDNFMSSGQRFSRVDADGTLRFARFDDDFSKTETPKNQYEPQPTESEREKPIADIRVSYVENQEKNNENESDNLETPAQDRMQWEDSTPG